MTIKKAISNNESNGTSRAQEDEPISYLESLGVTREQYETLQDAPAQISFEQARKRTNLQLNQIRGNVRL
jgi:hypothetical protein